MTDPYNAVCNALRSLPDDRMVMAARIVDVLSSPAPTLSVHEAASHATWAIAGLGERGRGHEAALVAAVVEAMVEEMR